VIKNRRPGFTAVLLSMASSMLLLIGACKTRASMISNSDPDKPKLLVIVLNSDETIEDAEKLIAKFPRERFSFVNLGQNASYQLKKRPICNVLGEVKNEGAAKYEKSIQLVGKEIKNCLITLKEEGYDLLVADADESFVEAVALARSALKIEGLDLEHARYFRDKFLMKEKLRNAGIKVPKFAPAEIEAALALAAETKYPIVLKPRTSQGSLGIQFLQDEAQLRKALQGLSVKDRIVWEVEEAIDQPILHIDFAADQGRLKYLSASQYLVTAFDFYRNNKAVATILLNNPEQLSLFRQFATSVIKGLDHDNGVFHLEAFLGPGNELTFLEIAHRVGGSLVSEVVKNVHGFDLGKAHLLLQLGLAERVMFDLKVSEDVDKSGGLLVVPKAQCPPKTKPKLNYTGNGKTFETVLETSLDQVNAKRMRVSWNAAEFIFKGTFEKVKSEMNFLLENLSVVCQ
jgi:biotin carboxylase